MYTLRFFVKESPLLRHAKCEICAVVFGQKALPPDLGMRTRLCNLIFFFRIMTAGEISTSDCRVTCDNELSNVFIVF